MMIKTRLLATAFAFAPTVALAHGPAEEIVPADDTAQSQEQLDASALSDDQSQKSGEIVVTATRRETRLSRTPVAVAVVGNEDLAKAAINSEQDLQVAIPGLIVRAGQSSNQLNFALRGQSLDAYSFGRPGVLPYFNEVQVSNPTGTSSTLYDLESIQVFKGPQGTLFGRNSTGGAVLYTTARPSYDVEGYASALGGNFGTFRGEGAVNLPIATDTAAVRVAGFYSTTDGFQKNVVDGTRRGDSEKYGVRGTLRLDLNKVHNTLTVDYQYASGTSITGALGNIDTSQPFAFPTAALYDPASSDFVLGLVLQGLGVPAGSAGALANGNFQRYLQQNPAANPQGLAAEFAAQQARGPFQVSTDVSDAFTSKILQISNRSTIELTDEIEFRNILGYVNVRATQFVNVDGSAFGITQSGGDGILNRASAFSEEAQIAGDFDNLNFVVGGYYSFEKAQNTQTSLLFDIIPFGLLTGSQNIYGIVQNNSFTTRNTTYAVYGQGTYEINDRLSLTAGLRYTNETIRGVVEPFSGLFSLATTGLLNPDGSVLLPPSAFSNDQELEFGNLSWTTGISYEATSQLFLYAMSRRGYKNGGFNGLVQPRIGFSDAPVLPGNAYRTETVTDLEVGTKFNGRLGSMPASFNLAGYYNWIEDSQRTAFVSVGGNPAAITVTVPRARVYGIELDGSISPSDWLTIGGSLNYTNARFTDNLVTVGAVTQPFNTYPDTPEWSGMAYADATFGLTERVDLLLHADVFAQSRTFFSSTANLNPGAQLPGYALTNFRVGLEDNAAGWSLTANLRNAFDRTYFVGGLPLAELTQINTVIPGAPRTFTIEARIRF